MARHMTGSDNHTGCKQANSLARLDTAPLYVEVKTNSERTCNAANNPSLYRKTRSWDNHSKYQQVLQIKKQNASSVHALQNDTEVFSDLTSNQQDNVGCWWLPKLLQITVTVITVKV